MRVSKAPAVEIHQIQPVENTSYLASYWAESFEGLGRAWASGKARLDKVDTSWISTQGVFLEDHRETSCHLAEFHIAVNNLARPDTNIGGITSIISGLTPLTYNTLVFQWHLTPAVSFMKSFSVL